MSGPRRWLGVLLRLFPAEFRERHGSDMLDTFDRAWAERRTAGRLSRAAFLVRTSVDVAVSGLGRRLARTGASSRRGRPRPGRGLVSWLDVKLGLRMLAKHPGLTLVSTFALAVGIPVGLAPDHFVDGLMAPLPVPDGDRIRSLRLWSPALGQAERTTELDFRTWRDALSSFEVLGAFRETAHNVEPGPAGEASVRGAEVTGSTFDVLRVAPLLGRGIRTEDETPGGEAVVVIGHDLWQGRFGADPDIVGKAIRLGGRVHTVVGVMPAGFLFPRHQQIWTPLSAAVPDRPEDARPVVIFGRLAADATDAGADAEFRSVAFRSAHPDRDPRVRPQVAPYAYTLLRGLSTSLRATPEYMAFRSLALAVLLVACVNVGMLVSARTATRATELAVRTALGASRARIVAQVLTECLVLALLAAGAGVLLVAAVVEGMWYVLPARLAQALPFWVDWSPGGAMVLRALALAGVSAVVAGIVPALRYTGASVQSTMQRAKAARGGTRFGGLSGALIVADVAVAVGALGFAVTAFDLVRDAGQAHEAIGIPAEEFLGASLAFPSIDGGGTAAVPDAREVARRAATQTELVSRLRAEPGVRAVAVADALPRMDHSTRLAAVEGVELPDDRRGLSVRVARVDVDFFESLNRPVLAGRGFDVGDLAEGRSTVIVNTTFVERMLGGQNAVGRRLRFIPWGDGDPGPWKEIVGVVDHLGMRLVSAESDQGVYEPIAPGELASVRLGIHVGDDPASFAPRLRTLAAEVDPGALVSVIGPLDDVYEGDWYVLLAAGAGGGLLIVVLLALAASGIYAFMSHSVAERTTEIGIRAALGAGRPGLARIVARRAVLQLVAGVALGIPIAALFLRSREDVAWGGAASAVAAGVVVLVLVGLVSCTGPTLRALRVDPLEALRADG